MVLRNRTLRPLVEAVLGGDGYAVEHCPSIESLMGSDAPLVQAALVDWSVTAGLLTEERRAEMQAFAARLPLVLIVPRGWGRHVSASDLGVAIMLEKPFEADALLDAVERCLSTAQAQDADGLERQA